METICRVGSSHRATGLGAEFASPKLVTARLPSFARAALFLCLIAWAPGSLTAQDKAPRTLLGNMAVRKELQLTDDQQQKIDAILTEMEQQIAAKLKSAKPDSQNGGRIDEDAIADPLVEKYGQQTRTVLDEKQTRRFWEIGAQAAGVGVFRNNRTQRVLQLTPEQLRQMNELIVKMNQDVVKIATDPHKDIPTIEAEVAREKNGLYPQFLQLLTAEQRKAFDNLLGKPFDLELLKTASGQKPRSLTFIFGLTYRNPHVLLADPDTQKQLELTDDQLEKVNALLKSENDQLTAVRLGNLKKLDRDFADLNDNEKRRVALTILDGANDVFGKTNSQVKKLLTERQVAQLDRRLVKLIGARAIGSDTIAPRLNLTAAQKQAFAAAEAEFEQKTAAMRVVRERTDFDSGRLDEQQKALEATARSLLTPAQIEKLEAIGQAKG